MEFFATCPKGFEQSLARELESLGCPQVRPLKGQVSFTGEISHAYRACLWSRLASRVVLVLGRVGARDADELYEGLRTIAWEEHLRSGASIVVDAHGTNEALRNTQFVALRTKDALVDTLLAKWGSRPVVDTRNPDLSIVVRISRNRATVGLDLSGEPLFKRGYEVMASKGAAFAPLRSDYAAALLTAGGWGDLCVSAREAGETPVLLALHPGAGTLFVEAAGMALDRAPGLTRQRWGLTGWASHDAQAWDALVEEAEHRASADASVVLLGYETRAGAEASARRMLGAAGINAAVRWGGQTGVADLVACDLSWVEPEQLAVQATVLARLSSVADEFSGAPLVALARDEVVDAAVGREPERTCDVIVGRDEATIRSYAALEAGAERPSVDVGDASLAVYVPASDQFAARLAKVARQRAKWARAEDVTCYRVYDADLPDYAVTIDLFEESLETVRTTPRRWLQMYEYAPPKGIDETLARKRLLDVLAIAPQVLDVRPEDVFLRTRQRARGGSQYADEAKAPAKGRPRLVAGAELPREAHLVDEGGLTFEVNFSTRLDCGIFLDHRDTRGMLREMAKQAAEPKRFLNLFAYTGTATCYAADGGMRRTTTVDLSRPSLDWARRNMARNGFAGPEHEFVQADVLEWVAEKRHSPNRWDLVFCDVPTFSNSQRMRKGSFDVQRDHVELLIGVSRLLARDKGEGGGTCVFSCNLRTFKPDVAALAKAGVTIEDITDQTIPKDFERNQRVHRCYLVRRA